MKVAVTGASGFIGSHLATHLEHHGHDVLSLRRTIDGLGFVPQDSALGAAEATDYLNGVEAVIHLAARQQDSPSTPLADYLQSNVAMTEQLLIAAAAVGVNRFVMASSRLVYPAHVQGPVAETCPHGPGGFYGLSKSVAEDLVRIYSARTDLSGVALRIGQVFGAGDRGRGVLPRFIEDARRGIAPKVTGTGAAVRDFVYVKDVVAAFRLAVEQDTDVPAINVGGGGHSIQQLASTVTTAAGMDDASIQYTHVADEDTSHYSLDCSLAGEQLGWAPAQSLVDSVRERLAEPA